MPGEPVAEDTGYAPSRWAFDEEVTRVFDRMLERSIPDYATMREVVTDVASSFLEQADSPRTVVDLGCSRGESLAPLVKRFGARHRYVGLEVSEPMLAACRARFAGMIEDGIVQVEQHDLRAGLLPDSWVPSVSVVLSVLTLMFVPVELRQRVVGDAAVALRPGGAMVLVEKCLGETAQTQRLMVERYHAIKARNGYSREEIDRKALSLQGVLVPLTPSTNERMLASAGFSHVERIWQCWSFAAWLALK